jgi:hypothetical protein
MNGINNQVLSQQERALIMGTLLGDAHLQRRDNSYRLKIEHGIQQKSYVEWKYKKLRRLCTTTQSPKVVPEIPDIQVKPFQTPFQTVVFYTSSGKWLKEFHDLFYAERSSDLSAEISGTIRDKEDDMGKDKKGEKKKYVKTITQKLIDSLPMDPMVLAVLFMDDGSVRDDCFAGKLATQGFTKEESKLLCQYLNKWNIDGHVVANSKAKNQYYIGLPAATFGNFVRLIEPIVREIPEMMYKLNNPNKTP